MVPLGVRIAAFFSVPMVVATSASAEEKKKAAPPQSRQSRVMFAIGKRTRRGHAAWSQIDPKAYPWRRTRRSHAPSNGPEAFFVAQFSAGYTTNMFGFDLRQGQPLLRANLSCVQSEMPNH
jgi:hypothetical protein